MNTQILNQREKKNIFFKTSPQSPIPRWTRKRFNGLEYFNYSSEFEFLCKISFVNNDKELKVSHSNGQIETYLNFANISFNHLGIDYKLTIYSSQNKNTLWLPFKDLTNKTESYSAGRYIDIKHDNLKNEHFELNFNTAYNPFCAYNDNYTCPLIPEENYLNIEIRAGEKYSAKLW
ncbi:MAG: DUF1684 domain-containing protein [Bacteroidales bacterium]|nr:DUF1684 domain-containing protein [Bacteroidales bacterium]